MVRRVLIASALCLAVASVVEARPVRAEWDANTDSFTTGYRLYRGNVSGTYTTVIDVGNVTTHTLDLPPGTYFFVVRAYNLAGQLGLPSSEVSFTISNQSPTVLNPGNLTISAGPVLAQLVGSDPDGDSLSFSATGLPGTVVINASTGAISGYILAGTYNVTLIVSDGAAQSQQSFVLTVVGSYCPGPPNAPALAAPLVTGSLVQASWTAPSTGTPPATYVVHVGTSPGQSNYIVIDLGSPVTAAQGPVPDGTYYLRLVSRNACGDSAPSNEVSFRVGPPAPAAPTAVSFQRSGSTVTLNWTAPASGTVTGYIVEAGSATGLNNLAVLPTGTTATTLSAFAPSGTYFVRVKATNSGGPGPASNEIIVNVP